MAQYARYYIIGAFLILFTFEYEMSLPERFDPNLTIFKFIMALAMISILLGLVIQELWPSVARQIRNGNTVKAIYFIFIGVLVATITLVYTGGAVPPAVSFAYSADNVLISLFVYNIFTMAPSLLLLALPGSRNMYTYIGRYVNREAAVLIGTSILVLSVLTLELISLYIA